MMDRGDIKQLKKRYLVWLYKTSKEALDKKEVKMLYEAEMTERILKSTKDT